MQPLRKPWRPTPARRARCGSPAIPERFYRDLTACSGVASSRPVSLGGPGPIVAVSVGPANADRSRLEAGTWRGVITATAFVTRLSISSQADADADNRKPALPLNVAPSMMLVASAVMVRRSAARPPSRASREPFASERNAAAGSIEKHRSVLRLHEGPSCSPNNRTTS